MTDPAMPCQRPAHRPRRDWLRQAVAWQLTGVAGLAGLAGCAAPWPEVPAGPGSPSARARLDDSAQAHGLAAFRALLDLNLGLQPLARGGRPREAAGPGALQWRCLPAQRLLAWHDSSGPLPQQGWRRLTLPSAADALPGRKAIRDGSDARDTPDSADAPDIRLWSAGAAVLDGPALIAAARQADLLALLLLGPLWLASTDRAVNWAEPATLAGLRCDQLTLDLRPGLGGQGGSRLALFIDREQGLLRRLRVLSDAEQGRPGAGEATWDLAEPMAWQGLVLPRRCQRMAPALPGLAAASAGWLLQGLDRNRGLQAADLAGPQFSPRAAVAAQALAPAAAAAPSAPA